MVRDGNLGVKALVYLTDEAWDYHVQNAARLGYIRAPLVPLGISLYFRMLSTLAYEDARHPDMRRDSPVQWSTGLMPAIVRMLQLDAHSILRLGFTARHYRIAPFRSQNAIRNGTLTRLYRGSLLVPDTQLV